MIAHSGTMVTIANQDIIPLRYLTAQTDCAHNIRSIRVQFIFRGVLHMGHFSTLYRQTFGLPNYLYVVVHSLHQLPLGPARAPFIPRRDRRELVPEFSEKMAKMAKNWYFTKGFAIGAPLPDPPPSFGGAPTTPPHASQFSPCPPLLPLCHPSTQSATLNTFHPSALRVSNPSVSVPSLVQLLGTRLVGWPIPAAAAAAAASPPPTACDINRHMVGGCLGVNADGVQRVQVCHFPPAIQVGTELMMDGPPNLGGEQ